MNERVPILLVDDNPTKRLALKAVLADVLVELHRGTD